MLLFASLLPFLHLVDLLLLPSAKHPLYLHIPYISYHPSHLSSGIFQNTLYFLCYNIKVSPWYIVSSANLIYYFSQARHFCHKQFVFFNISLLVLQFLHFGLLEPQAMTAKNKVSTYTSHKLWLKFSAWHPYFSQIWGQLCRRARYWVARPLWRICLEIWEWKLNLHWNNFNVKFK